MLYNITQRSAWTVSEANYTVPSYRGLRFKDEFATRYLRRAVNVTCIKSKVGLLQTAHYWANAGLPGVLFGARVGRRVAFETIKLIHAKVLCTIFDINYHPNIAHINMQGASVLVPTEAPTLTAN